MKRLLVITLILLAVSALQAQTVVSGLVLDRQTG